jgi:hypothetical protein
MSRLLLPLVALVAVAGCSSTDPVGDTLDPLSQRLLRATTEVPSFGGVAFEGERLVVFTLGEAPDAEAAVRALFGTEIEVEVRTRPARGQGSEILKDRAAAASFGAPGGISADYDETTGYVRVGVRDAASVRSVAAALEAAGLPMDQIIVQVETPAVAY